jgi:hypothetical protein
MELNLTVYLMAALSPMNSIPSHPLMFMLLDSMHEMEIIS